MTKILLAGANGQVGWELRQTLLPVGEVAAPGRDHLDLADPDSIRRAVREAKPDVIVNAAAYTAVDQAESEPELAMQINGAAPGILAEEAKRLGALIVHYSTDYVFDGTKDRPYVEGDPSQPVNSYGRSKLAGEQAIHASGARHLIFRTSWVYAARGSNFVRTLLRLARERPELKIVNDQVGAPTWARSLAGMTAEVLGTDDSGLARARENSGIYHYTSAGAVSWFGFGEAIFAAAARRSTDFRAPKLIPIPAAAYPLPARRPANSRLSTAKLTATFGVAPPAWEEALEQCFKEMGNGN
jgi:dTDP-4-dehydrorhamnose reductase